MQLSHQQRTEIYEQGFTIVRNAVSKVYVDAAMRAINHSLGEGLPADEMQKIRSQTYCRELTKATSITDLYNQSAVGPLVDSGLGVEDPLRMGYGQIAIRFPSMIDPAPTPRPHIDGIYSEHNGVPKGEIINFTALVSVILSPLPEPNMGNFTVWPGTHRMCEEYFRENGPEVLMDGIPKIDWPEPVQICGEPGDAVICHYAIGHSAAPNTSPHPRYAVFYRVYHPDHESHKMEMMTDIWLDWHGMRDVMPERVA